MLYDGSTNWSVASALYYYEASLKSDDGTKTVYYQFYNETDTTQIGEVSTVSTSYVRLRTGSLTMPSDDGNEIDGGRKGSGAFFNATATRSFFIAVLTLNTDAVGGANKIGTLNLMGVGN